MWYVQNHRGPAENSVPGTRLSRARIGSMKRLTLLLLTAAITLYAAPPAVNSAKAGMDSDLLARIPVRMKAFVDKGTIPGAVTLVERHGSVASIEAIGY